MPYINPIPYIEAGKEFELRLKVVFDEVVELETAKKSAAEYIKGLPMEDLEKSLACLEIKPVYPPESERMGGNHGKNEN